MTKQKISKLGWLTAVLLLGLVPLFRVWTAEALTLGNRSIRIDTSEPSASTVHVYNFDIPTSSTVGSMVFEYCSNNPFLQEPCTAPNGLDVSATNLDSQSGDTGYTVNPLETTDNKIVITRPPLVSNVGPAQYVFSDIVNPSDYGTVYVRITLHSSTDGTGPYGDGGGVVFSVTRKLSTQAFVPPFIIFCVGITVAPDCSSVDSGLVNLGELSSTGPNVATSQFAGATNDYTGFYTNLFARTLTSGNRIIAPMSSASSSVPGTAQFGLNMRDNSSPNIGQDPSGAGDSVLMPDYNVPNQFILKDGVVTSSTVSTEFNVFTVSYVANVPPDQPAGIYNTTLTYVATASF